MEPNLDNITKTPRVLFVDDEAIKLNPKDAKAYYGRGVMYQRLGQQELADRDFAAFRYTRKAKELKEE